ncbi:MAG: TatD family hydrolase [Candidatus Saccharimonadales bacterium]
MNFVDTHCHIQSIGLASTDNAGERVTLGLWAKEPGLVQVDVVSEAKAAGVSRMIVVGCTYEDSKLAIDCAARYEGTYASIGIHPHEAKHYTQTARADQPAQPPAEPELLAHRVVADSSAPLPYQSYGAVRASMEPSATAKSVRSDFAQEFEGLCKSSKVVAMGECGLDYYYGHSPKEDQIAILKFQIELALKHDLPLIFHVREAFADFWPIFDSYEGKIRGVLHSYTDNQANLERAIKAGLYIGVNGIATFAKSEAQIAVYNAIPLDNLLLETDAPFLTPVPHRGTICKPKHVRDTAGYLAELRGESLETLAAQTTQNAQTLFGLS